MKKLSWCAQRNFGPSKPTMGHTGEGPKVLSAIMCVVIDVLFPLWAGVCVASSIYILCVSVHVALYLPNLGTQNCRKLATPSPGRRNALGSVAS